MMDVIALCIAKAALNSVVKIVTTLFAERIGSLLGVQKELDFIRDEVVMMQAFLRTASEKRTKSEIMTTWIKQVQELALDAEDCLEEASIDLRNESWVWTGKKRDLIAEKIRALKTRTSDVSQRYQRFNLSTEKNDSHTDNESDSTISNSNVESLFVGLDEPKKELVNLILSEHEKQEVISVVGMDGLGKTTLVRKVYDCEELRDKFEYFAWFTVVRSFNMEEFKCSVKNVDKKYLIVLDNISSVSEWNKIKGLLPTVHGSRIVVTTQLRSLAESIYSDNIYEIRVLSKDDALDLFYKAVYKTSNVNSDGPSSSNVVIPPTEEMETQAGLIIERCGGLPLAIVSIGSYLATKLKTSAEWKRMHDHLSSELSNNPKLGVVNKTVLTSSYDGMPYHLKPCLLNLSVFHNHKEIRRSRIIRRWMSDGYAMQDYRRTAEVVGKSYFDDLMERSLIQPSLMSTIVNEDVKRCNIHNIMYELILKKAVEEHIVSLLEDQNLITMTDTVRHLVITGGSSKRDKALARVRSSHIRSLSIFGEVGDYHRYPRMKLIRVLDLEGTMDLDNGDLRCLGKHRNLKYLGLRGTTITELPDSLGNLSELETLDIRNTAIVRLPKGVTKLKKLSYLRAGFDHYNNSKIQHMGRVARLIFEMRSAFLHTSQTYRAQSLGVKTPQGLGQLGSLNILGIIDIGQAKGLAKEMLDLTNLRKLAVTGFSKKNGKTLGEVIDRLHEHLTSLVLEAVDDSGLKGCLEYVSSPPKFLKSLKLYSPLGELPNWISSLENLGKIHFRNTHLTEEIKAIENLQNLKVLYMSYSTFTGVTKLCFGLHTFPMLQVMILEEIDKLESMSIENTALKNLEQLKITCQHIREVSGLDFLVKLKEMEVVVFSNSESNKKFVSNVQEKLSMLPKKPVLRLIKK